MNESGDHLRFSLVIPCYDEARAIRETLGALHEQLAGAGPYEVIVVDDGSTDGTAEILAEEERRDSSLRVVTHPRNRGYGAALKTGVRHAEAGLVAITDADGTYPNDRIPDLLALAEGEKADMVVGARTGDDVRYPFLRKIPKWFLRRYTSWVAGRDVPDINSGLRVMRKDAIERFLGILPDGFSFTTTITLAMHTNYLDVRYVSVAYATRVGRSKIRPIRDTLNFAQLILRTGMYFAPIKVFSPLILVMGLGFCVSLGFDIAHRNLTDKTLVLLLFWMNTALFALLADMIDKRSTR